MKKTILSLLNTIDLENKKENICYLITLKTKNL